MKNLKKAVMIAMAVIFTLSGLSVAKLDVAWAENLNQSKDWPITKKTDTKIAQFSATGRSIAVIDEDGYLWMWGNDAVEAFGDGLDGDYTGQYVVEVLEPVQIMPGKKFKKVGLGSCFCAALDLEGKLWNWGINAWRGTLGDGTEISRSTPVNVMPDKTFLDIEVGNDETFALDDQWNLWGWGCIHYDYTINAEGLDEIGEPNPTLLLSGKKITYMHDDGMGLSVVDEDGKLWQYHVCSSAPPIAAAEPEWEQIDILNGLKVKEANLTGRVHNSGTNSIIDENGDLWLWKNELGHVVYLEDEYSEKPELVKKNVRHYFGRGNRVDNWTSSAAIDNNGKLIMWGSSTERCHLSFN